MAISSRFNPIARWRALPKAGRRAIVIALALNELRGIAVVIAVLAGAHHLVAP